MAEPGLYEIPEIPGKGRGLIALVNIDKRTRILAEWPILSLREPDTKDELEETLDREPSFLPDLAWEQFFHLPDCNIVDKQNASPRLPKQWVLTGIWQKNSFACHHDPGTNAVYPTICLINHSCLPNACFNWERKFDDRTIHASRAISAGEEITISYFSVYITAEARREKLSSTWDIDCKCEGCTFSTEVQRNVSDARRLKLDALVGILADDILIEEEPEAMLTRCREGIQLLREEFRGTTKDMHTIIYKKAAHICGSHGDEARSAVFANLAYEARGLCAGYDDYETEELRRTKRFPAAMSDFGKYSMRWVTRRMDEPSHWGAIDYEKWLWRKYMYIRNDVIKKV